MEIDGDSAGGSTNASWINPEDLGKCINVIYTITRHASHGVRKTLINIEAS